MILAQETKQTNKQTKNTKSYVAMALGNIHCKSKFTVAGRELGISSAAAGELLVSNRNSVMG